MVLEVTRLWLHIMLYTRKNKHQGWCFIKEEPSEYQGRQQECSNAQGQNMDNKKYYSRSNIYSKKPSSRKNYIIGRNLKEQHQEARSFEGTRKK